MCMRYRTVDAFALRTFRENELTRDDVNDERLLLVLNSKRSVDEVMFVIMIITI